MGGEEEEVVNRHHLLRCFAENGSRELQTLERNVVLKRVCFKLRFRLLGIIR